LFKIKYLIIKNSIFPFKYFIFVTCRITPKIARNMATVTDTNLRQDLGPLYSEMREMYLEDIEYWGITLILANPRTL